MTKMEMAVSLHVHAICINRRILIYRQQAHIYSKLKK